MTFIFAETQGMQSAAASTANLAIDTVNAGAQGQAAGAMVMPPGLDHVSATNAAQIKAYLGKVATQLAIGAGLQDIYGESVSNAAGTYTLVDELNATGVQNATGLGGLV